MHWIIINKVQYVKDKTLTMDSLSQKWQDRLEIIKCT